MDGFVTIWNALMVIFPIALFVYVFLFSLDKHLNKMDRLLPTKVKENKAGLIVITHVAIYVTILIIMVQFKFFML